MEQRFFGTPAGVTVGALTGNFYDQTDYLQSYFGRANFTISNKYLITATLRADGSSKFGDNYKYGIFPSGAIAWQIHEEDFLPETFNTLKLRVGYGVTGSQDGLGYGQYRRRTRWSDAGIGDNPQIGIPGSSAQGYANPDLKWESTAATGVGVDFGFLSDRLSGTFDWYNKQTEDLLLNYTVAQPALATSIFQNLGGGAVVENKGWEFSLNYEAVDNTDAGFSIGG